MQIWVQFRVDLVLGDKCTSATTPLEKSILRDKPTSATNSYSTKILGDKRTSATNTLRHKHTRGQTL